ncbi:Antirestriction protein [Pseudomonas chlororaphis subsp. piscium]|uniref:antirestriction protein ArdA n=1 Tax=Pseudomonas chlororaphis TaxID=587753 RepID=UPI000F589E66|nr:antirestriction protein ArdA [Pseudomonas chlororaphis]AZC49522.1 Antirestriction protein [Pseudomonas chlororaphis subsp. piscium]
MKMYAACLASYNNGVHHGAWFDLEDFVDDVEGLQQAIATKVLMTSRFPNVRVACPHCDGTGMLDPFGECPHCAADGSGTVPSAEEWAAHDYDGEALSGFGEYPNLKDLLEHVRLVSEHGDAWLAYIEWQGATNATEEDFEESQLGTCESPRDYFEENLEESGLLNEVPKELRGYIDFEAYARDQEMNGGYHFEEFGGVTYVFSN